MRQRVRYDDSLTKLATSSGTVPCRELEGVQANKMGRRSRENLLVSLSAGQTAMILVLQLAKLF